MTIQHVPESILRTHARLTDHIAALSLDPANANELANSETALVNLRGRWPGLVPDLGDPDISIAKGWRCAVEIVVAHWTHAGRCFSAGEVAKYLRDERRDLRFGVASLTEFVAAGWIEYAGAQAVEVPRVTEGLHRTPAGATVIVYAPSYDLGLAHEFEVEIPRPGPRALGARNAPAIAAVG